jgi:hypothetical protein
MERPPYKCYYCGCKAPSFTEIVHHLEDQHPDEEIKTRKLVTLDGKRQYQSKHLLGYIPSQIKSEGKEIQVDELDETLYIKTISTLTPDNDIKRQKAAVGTPKTSLRKDLFEDEHTILEDDDELAEPLNKTIWTQTKDTVSIDVSDIDERDRPEYEELLNIIPSVIANFKAAGLGDTYLKFCRLISSGKFDMHHISLLLFLDVVEFFSTDNTCGMRYRFPETIRFWQVGRKLFHGRFLRFMGGSKNIGHKLSGGKSGFAGPDAASVNFVVPNLNMLIEKDSAVIDKNINPGPIAPVIETVITHGKFANGVKLTVDAKKIKKGYGKKRGEIDMDGREDSPTLKERQARLEKNNSLVGDARDVLDTAETCHKKHLGDFSETQKSTSVSLFKRLVIEIGGRLQDLREKKLQLERSLTKLIIGILCICMICIPIKILFHRNFGR